MARKSKTKMAATAASRQMAKNKAASQASKSEGESEAKSVLRAVRGASKKITTSSTAEYFSKNLQQVGFSSPTKAVLTTLKEAMDNALDACEDAGILPEIRVLVQKVGPGSLKNTDRILIRVEDNGPGLDPEDVPKVFGEYLASSKFGRGRCSRGQQGIGISAATTWAMQTTATGAKVLTRRKGARKALSCVVDMDLKNNKGLLRDKQMIEWEKPHGTVVEFLLDGRIQLNGEGGLLTYLRGNILLNPHLTLHYDVGEGPVTIERVSQNVPVIPDATEPHPHTMKLGEFISHARLFGKVKVRNWLKNGFSRMSDRVIEEMWKEQKLPAPLLDASIDKLGDAEFNQLFVAVQNTKLMAPATNTVLSVGEDALALSIRRLGDIDFFSVLTRKPTIADFKPVQVEVAIARLRERTGADQEEPVQVLRFANRVPLQFDKAACAIVKAITSVTWRSYGLKQPKGSLPLGPYIIAVSIVSPFIKFKNASKETIDASDELVEEIRRALMQCGQRLSRYLKREHKASDLEQKIQHIEQFGPILVETLARILEAPESRKSKAAEGLAKILERDTKGIKQDLKAADEQLTQYLEERKQRLAGFFEALEAERAAERSVSGEEAETDEEVEAAEAAEANEAEEEAPKGRGKGRKASAAAEPAGRAKAGKAKAAKRRPAPIKPKTSKKKKR